MWSRMQSHQNILGTIETKKKKPTLGIENTGGDMGRFRKRKGKEEMLWLNYNVKIK